MATAINDVVVKYESKVYQNSDNRVVESTEEFTNLHSGAKLNNSFAYQNPNLAHGATVSFEGSDGLSTVDAGGNTTICLAGKVLDMGRPMHPIFYATVKAKNSYRFAHLLNCVNFVLSREGNHMLTHEAEWSKKIKIESGTHCV